MDGSSSFIDLKEVVAANRSSQENAARLVSETSGESLDAPSKL
jgi:hypothetical protein